MRFLYRYSIFHPRRVLAISALITLGMVPGMFRLELRTDGRALVPPQAPAVLLDRAIREEFGLEDPMVILIQSGHPRGIFNPGTLRLVRELTRDIQGIEGLSRSGISSLETEPGDHYRTGTLELRRLLEPLPATPEECERLRGDLEAIGIYTGTLVSTDGKATAILVGAPPEGDRVALCAALAELAAARVDAPETIHIIGAPIAEAQLGLHILRDLGVPSSWLRYRPAEETGGSPGLLAVLRRFLSRSIGLVPAAIALMGVVFLASFRRPGAAVLPLAEAGACLVFTFGFMGCLGIPVYLTTTVIPVLLTAIGVADEIHIFSRYSRLLRERGGELAGGHAGIVLSSMDEMYTPVVKTSATTGIAFLSFLFSPILPVRMFGLFTAVGILYCLLFSLTAIPAILALLRPRWFVSGARRAPSRIPSTLASLVVAVSRRPRLVLGALLLLIALTPLGLRRVRVQDSWIGGFAPDSEFYRATEAFNEGFFGTHLLVIRADTGRDVRRGEIRGELVDHHGVRLPGDLVKDPRELVHRGITISSREPGEDPARDGRSWRSWIESASIEEGRLVLTFPRKSGSPKFFLRLSPEDTVRYEIAARRLLVPGVLRCLQDLEHFLKGQRDRMVGGVLGPVDYLTTTSFIVSGRDPAARTVPDNPRRIEELWSLYRRIRGEKRLREVIDSRYERALLTAYLKDANYVDTARLLEEIGAHERKHLEPRGIQLSLAGDVATSQAMIDGIVATQIRCLLIALAGILAVTAILGRSPRWGLFCVIPCGLSVLANFAVMGWTATPLGVATSMFAGMTLGIGVDYAIHLLERFRAACARGLEAGEALSDAVNAAGPAILIDGLAVGLGFGILTISRVPANARLGGIAMLSILGCLAATMLVLPSLMRLFLFKGFKKPPSRRLPSC